MTTPTLESIPTPPTSPFIKLQAWSKQREKRPRQRAQKESPSTSEEKLCTLPKIHFSKSSIVSAHLSPHEKINLDNSSEQTGIDLQKATKVSNTHADLRNSN